MKIFLIVMGIFSAIMAAISLFMLWGWMSYPSVVPPGQAVYIVLNAIFAPAMLGMWWLVWSGQKKYERMLKVLDEKKAELERRKRVDALYGRKA
jgi:hypothetical protein